MTFALASSSALPPAKLAGVSDLFRDWLDALSLPTKRAYRQSFKIFSAWFEREHPEVTPEIAASGIAAETWCPLFLLSLSAVEANRIILKFRTWAENQNRAPATVNMYIAPFRSIANVLNSLGVISWSFMIKDLKNIPYRNTKGPGLEGVKLLLEETQKQTPRHALRNEVIILLMFCLGLRVGEVCKLDVSDFEIQSRRIRVTGKGRRQGEYISLPANLYKKMIAWLKVREEYAVNKTSGPLFLSFDFMHDRNDQEYRMTRFCVFQFMRALGQKVGVEHAHPHGIRHAAITEALKSNNGNLVQAMRFSRHKDPRTLMVYDDAVADVPGVLAAELEKRIGGIL